MTQPLPAVALLARMDTRADAFIDLGLSALEAALRDRNGDLRNVQLATVSAKGCPALRTIVLRAFGRASATAELHSDSRAAKVRDIGHCDEVALLAWSAAEHLQIRFDGAARLHREDDVARERWAALSPNGRKAYGRRAEPGRPTSDPDDQSLLPPEEQFRNFTVIRISLRCLDILRLEPEGRQTRAFGRFTSSSIDAEWIGA